MHWNKIRMALIGFSMTQYAHASQSTTPAETFWLWIALFTLGILTIAVLFFSSYKTKKMQKLHQAMFDKQLEMEKNQNLLLTTMSENIHTIAKQALEQHTQLIGQTSNAVQNEENSLIQMEHKLLDVTNDLIDFLRLKSKKIEIVNEEFNINNMLNELSGSICSEFSGSPVELIFDIDKDIPRRLVGDSLHLGQALKSILEHMLNQDGLEEVRLEISMSDTSEEQAELQFQFTDIGRGLDAEALENLFVPYYDEETETYVRLGLYVANELVNMMGGKLSVQSIEGKGSTFTLFLPFEIAERADKRKYRLPDKVLIEKKVFIVDKSYHSALAIKKKFAYFRHEVKVLSQEEFMKNMPNLNSYDIVVLHESLFSVRLIEYLNTIKMEKDLKVIALNSLLQSDKKSFEDPVIDTHLFKPVNQERVFEMIIDLYNIKTPVDMEEKYNINTPDDKKEEKKKEIKRVKTHRTHINETKDVTKESFKDFSGKNLLIVDDNLINQKVLVNLLQPSGMDISVAGNGQEAVDKVKEGETEFDLVLMDINMPIMDGYAATQMIRLDKKFDGLPIVAFTALVLDSEIQKMFNCGINAFLSKPLNIGKLYTAFSMYLSDESPEEAPAEKAVEPKEVRSYEGINIEKGIKRASNSEALYLEVLKEFNTAYGHSGEIFAKLIQEHRYEQARMLCIDMRGLTGTIAAEEMHDLVSEILHQLVYKNYEKLANYKEKYMFEIQRLSRSIDRYSEAA
ncbi:MAG TPA: response regulator [Sulfurovum sp.]|uniref:response regulator n=1 Tax=Sulfurovum sp. TaxID=1969726 RepID=UPI002F91F627